MALRVIVVRTGIGGKSSRFFFLPETMSLSLLTSVSLVFVYLLLTPD